MHTFHNDIFNRGLIHFDHSHSLFPLLLLTLPQSYSSSKTAPLLLFYLLFILFYEPMNLVGDVYRNCMRAYLQAHEKPIMGHTTKETVFLFPVSHYSIQHMLENRARNVYFLLSISVFPLNSCLRYMQMHAV